MAGPSIDSLLQAVAPPRAADSSRSSDARSSFRPVLDEALQADSRDATDDRDRSELSTPIADDSIQAAGYDDSPAETAAHEHESNHSGAAANTASGQGDHAATTAASEEAAAADVEDKDASDEDDGGDAHDAVDISPAAAEAAAEVASAQTAPTQVPAEVNGDAATEAPEIAIAATSREGDGENSAPGTPTPDADGKPSSLREFGDALAKTPRILGEAPPDLSTLKAAAEAAKAAESATRDNAATASAKKATARKGETAKATSGVETAANTTSKDATENAAVKTSGGTGVESAIATDEVINDATLSGGDRPNRVKSATAQTAQQTDVPVAAVADGGVAQLSTGAATTEPSLAPAATAAPAVAAVTKTNEPAATARSAAALARLSADRSIHSSAGQTDEVDRARFVGRVEGAIRTAQQRDGKVQVRLSPPELGALRIELTVQNGVMSARLEAETPAARNLLLDNLPALRDRLAQQDVRIDQFDVDVRRDGGGANAQQQQQDAQDRPAQESAWRQRQDRAAGATAKVTPSARRSTPASDAALDVRV